MSSADPHPDSAATRPPGQDGDVGLLAPARAGSTAEEATDDTAFLQAMLDAEAALTRAQAGLGLAPQEAAGQVTEVAKAELFDVRELALQARSGGNPVIPLAAELATVAGGEAAGYVHRGATSQDVLDSALMLTAARALDGMLPDLARAADALAELAGTHRDTAMPGRTLTQHAVPTTFGLKAAGWRSLVLDAHDRLTAVRAALPAQLGGAAGTLAAFDAYARAGDETLADGARPAADGPSAAAARSAKGEQPQDAGSAQVEGADGAQAADGGTAGLRLLHAYARELGLAEPELPWHTLRTPVADLAGALAFCCGALGKLAADVLVLSRTEIGEVAEGSGGGSSAMPHKSNPVQATLIAAAARQAPALSGVLTQSLAAEDERPGGAWHAEWQPLRELIRLAGGAAAAAAELAGGLQVFPYRMQEHLDLTDGMIVSERIAAELGPLLGRERAKELLTTAAQTARTEGIALDEALEEAMEAAGHQLRGLLGKGRLRELTDAARYVGSAPELTDRALRRTAHPAAPQY